MKIQFFSDQLRESLEKKLSKLTSDRNDLVKQGQAVNLIRDTIHDLKTFVASYTFRDSAEEVQFFKNLKPQFVSVYLFHRKLFALALFDSFRDQAARLVNYQEQLNKLERYTLKNSQYYEYWITGSTDLDSQYFLRGKSTHRVIDADEKFTTGYDTKFAKLIANEHFRKHILSLIAGSQKVEAQSFGLTWTADKVALIELIYALHSTKAVNKGDADIKVLAKAFESIFSISLGNFYRKFQDFKFRKDNPARFLDDLKTNLIRKIDESDA